MNKMEIMSTDIGMGQGEVVRLQGLDWMGQVKVWARDGEMGREKLDERVLKNGGYLRICCVMGRV